MDVVTGELGISAHATGELDTKDPTAGIETGGTRARARQQRPPRELELQ